MTEYVDTREVARRTKLSQAFFVQKRIHGRDPIPFVKVGTRVLYRWSDVEAWLDAKLQANTSEMADAAA